MALRREKLDVDSIRSEIEEAKVEQERAQRARAAAERRRPTVESIVSYLEDRRRVNGFGEDFEITQLRRKTV